MNDASTPVPSIRSSGSHLAFGLSILAGVLAMLLVLPAHPSMTRAADSPQTTATIQEPSIGGIRLFASWPNNQKPDAAIVLSGETYGFLQPCGCSHPQKGGLERRAQFIQSLKAKGWAVAGVDLGDIFPDKSVVQEQGLLKYKTIMNSLREMGYIAVGLGKTDFKAEVDRELAEYALQKQQPPFILAGNLMGRPANGMLQPRQERFQVPGGTRPMVDVTEFTTVGTVPMSVTGIVGGSTSLEVDQGKLDPSIAFADNRVILPQVVAAIAGNANKPVLNILLFQGTSTEAQRLAKDFPQFNVILCQADDSEPPQYPTEVAGKTPGQKTLILQLGHKGRYVGVLGAFKNALGGVDLKYQLVPLGEEYVTPGTEAEALKSNPTLPLLELYARLVRDRKYADEVPRISHPAQILEPKLNLSFVGSAKCQGCHAAEFAKWQGTKHAGAFQALVHDAKRPSLRQFDGECIVCHTVGFGFKTGYQDEQKTPHLLNVGCESCHGPGSGHAANPKEPSLLKLMSPWKQKSDDHLPDVKEMKKMAEMNGSQRGQVALAPATQFLINKTTEMCMRCHNTENDPNFDLYTYWPKITHSGLGNNSAKVNVGLNP